MDLNPDEVSAAGIEQLLEEEDLSERPSAIPPVNPNMGVFLEQAPPGSGKWIIRMGGKPLSDFSGLLPDQVYGVTPFHFRKADVTEDVKGFNVRSKGLKEKFSKTDDVLHFQAHVWKHLWAHGLDTISYLQDPSDTSRLLNVVEHHPKYTSDLKKTAVLADKFRNEFDDFDKSNDEAAKSFLLNSLENKLSAAVERKLKEKFTKLI